MTDAEADASLLEHGNDELETRIGTSTFALKRKGGPMDEHVGFIVPDNQPQPAPDDVKRFLVRWFVGAYGA